MQSPRNLLLGRKSAEHKQKAGASLMTEGFIDECHATQLESFNLRLANTRKKFCPFLERWDGQEA